MSYVENVLGDHERLVLKPRFPALLRFASWAALLLLVALPVLVFAILTLTGQGEPGVGLVVISLAALGAALFVWTQVYMLTTEVAVTSHRFIIKRGLIARHTTELPLTSIENVDLHQGVWPRLFGYGHMIVAGSGRSALRTPPMQDPVSFRTAISEARIAVTQPPAFDAKAQRIDPMQMPDGPLLDPRTAAAQAPGRTARRAPGRAAQTARPAQTRTGKTPPRRLR